MSSSRSRYGLLPNKKRLNSQILTKTEIALEAIKNYEARVQYALDRGRPRPEGHLFGLMQDIDEEYTRIHEARQLELDKLVKVQIYPYNDQYYYIDTRDLLFPVRVFLKGVKNEGVLYVGYDRTFPGVDLKPADEPEQKQKKSYDYKFNFSKDIMCVLKNDKKRRVQKIYLTFMAKKQLLMFNLKFDYIGYESMEEEPQQTFRRGRAITEGNLQGRNLSPDYLDVLPNVKSNKISLETIYRKNIPETERQDDQPLQRSKTQIDGMQELHKSSKLLYRNNTLNNESAETQQKKNFVKQNLVNLILHKRSRSKEALLHRKEQKLISLERIKANKEQLQQYKQKQKEIRQSAFELKKSIEQYQRLYKQEKMRDKKMVKLLSPLVYMSMFVLKSNLAYNRETQSVGRAFSVRYLIKKFTKQLRKKYIENVLQIGNFKIRNQMSTYHILQLTAKSMNQFDTKKSGGLIFRALESLEPALVLNHSLNQATKYRQAVRLIQKRWLLKYRARTMMLQNFGMRHVEAVVKQFPHLRMGLGSFRSGGHCSKICYEYMVDESIKFRSIYDAYVRRVQEIEEFIEANYKIREYNKGKPEAKWRKYLDIPRKPHPPQHRIFRNLDILKSMIRGWFELEYKKILKKTISAK